MANENDKNAVLAAQHDPAAKLAQENAELRQRLAEMQGNVVSGGFRGEGAKYYLNEPCFLDDTWWPAGTVLEYDGEPNRNMVPRNEVAKRAMQAHLQHLAEGARAKAAQRGQPFVALVTDKGELTAQAMQEARGVMQQAGAPIVMPEAHGPVPAMPHLPEAQAGQRRRGPGAQQRHVTGAELPAVGHRADNIDLGAPQLAPTSHIPPAVTGRAAGGS